MRGSIFFEPSAACGYKEGTGAYARVLDWIRWSPRLRERQPCRSSGIAWLKTLSIEFGEGTHRESSRVYSTDA